MKEIKYVITDPLGMHARPAGMLVKAVAPYASKVTITAPTGTADARRLMALMKLERKPCCLLIVCKVTFRGLFKEPFRMST